MDNQQKRVNTIKRILAALSRHAVSYQAFEDYYMRGRSSSEYRMDFQEGMRYTEIRTSIDRSDPVISEVLPKLEKSHIIKKISLKDSKYKGYCLPEITEDSGDMDELRVAWWHGLDLNFLLTEGQPSIPKVTEDRIEETLKDLIKFGKEELGRSISEYRKAEWRDIIRRQLIRETKLRERMLPKFNELMQKEFRRSFA